MNSRAAAVYAQPHNGSTSLFQSSVNGTDYDQLTWDMFRVTNLSSNRLKLTVTLPTDVFKGTMTNPAATTEISSSRVMLKAPTAGRGFFLSSGQSGQVYSGP